MNLDATALGTIVAVASAISVFAGWVISLMTKSALFDYDKDLRARLHDWREHMSEAITGNSVEIEKLKERLRKNGQ